MSARSIVLIAAALLLVIGTVFVARAWLDSQRQVAAPAPEPKKVEAVRVLVAEVALPAGTFLKEEHMRWQAWPTGSQIPESYLVKTNTQPNDIYGAVIRRGIAAGEPITQGRIIKPGERGFMAAVLTPGYRAMSIKIGADSGVAGLVFPGDRVDIILTHNLEKDDGVSLGITCSVCHDPHDAINDHQLRFPIDVPDINQNLCMKCHQRRAIPDLAEIRWVLNGSRGYFDAARVSLGHPRMKVA